ncbi:hypothetical protein D9A70_11710, partial [Streptococcus agalactiae]|uniref:hypothetical protein n=1 Tax=Streptococcus agalactiae TaxID=1311 RepID=UPI000F12AC5E
TSTATMENSVEIPLKKLQIKLPYDPAIPMLGIHTEETRIETSTATMENSVEIPLKKLQIKLPYDPAIPMLGI